MSQDEKKYPKQLPDDPSFRIDAKDEPNAPASGSADESPTNLSPDGFLEFEQTNGTDQPIWEEDHWRFAGDDYWKGSFAGPLSQQQEDVAFLHRDEFTVTCIFTYDDTVEDIQNLVSTKTGFANPGFLFQVDNRDGDRELRCQVSGLFLSTGTGGLPAGSDYIIATVKFNKSTGQGSLWVNGEKADSSSADLSSNTDPAQDNIHIGSDVIGGSRLTGQIKYLSISDNGISDSQYHTFTYPYLKRKFGIGTQERDPVSTTYSNQLLGNACVLIDGLNDPSVPADGVNDELIGNLVPNDQVLSNSVSTQQPTWDDTNSVWNFDGTDAFENNNPKYSQKFTVAFVASTSDPDSNQNIYGIGDILGAGSYAYLEFRSQKRIRIRASDVDGNTLAENDTNISETGTLIAAVGVFDFEKGEIELYTSDDTFIELSNSSLTSFEATTEVIGASGVVSSFHLTGDVRSIIRINERLSESQIRSFLLPYLEDKHGLSNTEPTSVRLPKSFKSNPDIWIDATQEPDPPAVDSGDENPSNISPVSDQLVSQDAATNKPIWKGDRWDFAGDDYWDISNFDKDPDELTISIVIKKDSDGSTARFFHHGANPFPRIRV